MRILSQTSLAQLSRCTGSLVNQPHPQSGGQGGDGPEQPNLPPASNSATRTCSQIASGESRTVPHMQLCGRRQHHDQMNESPIWTAKLCLAREHETPLGATQRLRIASAYQDRRPCGSTHASRGAQGDPPSRRHSHNQDGRLRLAAIKP